MGTVQAARSIALRPRVTGELVEVSPECIPGGRFREGEVIAVIDPADTRRELVAALAMLWSKRERLRTRRHDNTPL